MKFKVVGGFVLWTWLFLLVAGTAQYLLGLGGYFVSDQVYAIEFWMFIVAVVLSAHVQGVPYVSIFFIFQCCVFLFLGGKLIALSLGADISGSPFDLDFMANYAATPEIKNSAFFYVGLLIVATNVGYYTAIFKSTNDGERQVLDWRPIFVLVIVSAIPFLMEIKDRLSLAFHSGYESIYLSQTGSYSAGAYVFQSVFAACVALCFATQKRFMMALAIFLMAIQGVSGMAMGGRGQFLTVMATFLWLYGRSRKIGLARLVIVFVVLGASTNLLLGFSARAGGVVSRGLVDGLLSSLVDQGVSLGVFSYSLTIPHYPIMAYFQEVIPGTSLFASIFSNQDIKPTDLSFSAFLSSVANMQRFNKGNGLGWSMLADAFVFSMGFAPVFFVLCALFGRAIAALDVKSKQSNFWFALAVSLAPRVFFLPRSSFGTIITFLPYFVVAYWVFMKIGRRAAKPLQPFEDRQYCGVEKP